MKIATIIGTRPNFIKCAPLSKEIRKHHKEILIHTGQHYDYEMNKIFLSDLNIPEPDFHLEIGSGFHGEQTGKMLQSIERVLLNVKPDLTLVFGDCNNTIAGALASVKIHIPVGHVESGLRSFDKKMPEEINRILVDHCSDLLFCPTKTSMQNLKKEGLIKDAHLTGDLMVDAINHNKNIASKSNILDSLNLQKKDYIVATIHRANNTDNKKNLESIIECFNSIDENIIFPIHPRTQKSIKRFDLNDKIKKNVRIIKPLGYIDFLNLMNNAKMILTDSGGIQKEAYILKIPCITLRHNTEWVETIDDGWNMLVGTNKNKILNKIDNFFPPKKHSNHFGDGNARIKILRIIENYN